MSKYEFLSFEEAKHNEQRAYNQIPPYITQELKFNPHNNKRYLHTNIYPCTDSTFVYDLYEYDWVKVKLLEIKNGYNFNKSYRSLPFFEGSELTIGTNKDLSVFSQIVTPEGDIVPKSNIERGVYLKWFDKIFRFGDINHQEGEGYSQYTPTYDLMYNLRDTHFKPSMLKKDSITVSRPNKPERKFRRSLHRLVTKHIKATKLISDYSEDPMYLRELTNYVNSWIDLDVEIAPDIIKDIIDQNIDSIHLKAVIAGRPDSHKMFHEYGIQHWKIGRYFEKVNGVIKDWLSITTEERYPYLVIKE